MATGGVPLPTAVAGGLLSIGDAHGGAIEQCARMLEQYVREGALFGLPPHINAKHVVRKKRDEKQRILGFGHRVHTNDPRTERLVQLAKKLDIAGPHLELALHIQEELSISLEREMPLNVDGAVAAIMMDMGFPWTLGKGFFLIGRAAGLTAQVHEEMVREKPMRPMFSADHDYDGPDERDLPRDFGK
ncbi:MAG TPA: citryl-CoA lyase [Euryarchaeota archaeon]|nr:citryl-CoA lyase [Euryarchaeota archaeon]